jgi:hypothetical protein
MTFTPDGVPVEGTPAAEPAPAKSGVSKKIVAFGIAGVVALGALGVGAAYAAYSVFGGGGAQPEEVLPGNAIAFSKLDLDPSADQKLALYRLTKKFPTVSDKVKSEESSIQDAIFGSIFEGDNFGLTYDDIKPWLGKRAAVAVFPASSTDAPVDVAVVLAVTDRDKAKAALDGAEDVGYAFAEKDFVILSETDAMAKSIVDGGRKATLAEAKDFGTDVDSLDGDQVSVAWADLGKVRELAEKNSAGDADLRAFSDAVGKNLQGRIVLGLHAESDYLELQGNAVGTGDATAKLGTGNAGELLAAAPAGAVAAASVSGLGDVLTEAYNQVSANGGDFADTLGELDGVGLDLPGDLTTILGSETAIVVTDAEEPNVGVVTRNDDPQKSLDAVSPLVDLAGPDAFRAERTDRGLVAATAPDLLAALRDGKGNLAGSDKFTQVVADPGGAVVAYVDLAAFIDANRDDPDYADMKALKAAGLSVRGGDDASFRLRLSFR